MTWKKILACDAEAGTVFVNFGIYFKRDDIHKHQEAFSR